MKLSFKLYILVTLYKINLCMSNIISLKYYFLCENELVWREFSKNLKFEKNGYGYTVTVTGTGTRVHGHGRHGYGFTGTGVRVCTGFFWKIESCPFNTRARVPVDTRGTGTVWSRYGHGRTGPGWVRGGFYPTLKDMHYICGSKPEKYFVLQCDRGGKYRDARQHGMCF